MERDGFWRDVTLALVLLAAGLKFTSGVENALDIGAFDESYYLHHGVTLGENGLPRASWGPLYAVWYRALSGVQPDRVGLYYLNCRVLTIALPLLLYAVLRRLRLSGGAPAWIAFFFLICSANLPSFPKPSHFALVLILLSLILAMRKGKTPDRRWASVGALVAAYVRPEFFLTFVLMVLLWSREVLVSDRRFREGAGLGTVVGLSLLLLFTLGFPVGGDDGRDFVAFGQHFALNWTRWTGSSLNPWTEWEAIVSRNFGDAHSLAGAFRSNPQAFVKHALSNLANTPRELLAQFSYHANVLLPNSPGSAKVERFALLGLAAFCLFRAGRGVGWRRALETQGTLLALLACYLVPSFLSTMLIHPRSHYLLTPGVLIVLGAGAFLSDREEREVPTGWARIALTGALMLFLTPRVPALPPEGRPNANTAAFIRSLGIGKETPFLEAEGGCGLYLDDRFRRVAASRKRSDFAAFLKGEGIAMVIVTDRLKDDPGFREDGTWRAFLDHPEASGYAVMKVPDANRQVIVDRRLLTR